MNIVGTDDAATNDETLSQPGRLVGFRPRTALSPGVAEGPAAGAASRRDALYRGLLAGADVLAAMAALALGVAVIGDEALQLATLAAAPAIAILGKLGGLYDRDQHVLRRATLDEAPAVFRVATLFSFLFWLADEPFIEGFLGRDQALGIWGMLLLFMLAGRAGARRLAGRLSSEERCLVMGHPEAARELELRLATTPAVNARVVGRISLSEDDDESLEPTARRTNAERVLISPRAADGQVILDAIRRAKVAGLKVSVLPRLLEAVGSSVQFDDIEGVTVLAIRKHSLSRSSAALKRAMDVAGAGVGLVAMAPLALLAAAVAPRGSGESLLLREPRVGRGGSEFELLRFRTGPTYLGELLRRTHLDRLPELLNVLRGHISLVGPRPQRPEQEDRHRRASDPVLPPGLTGLWQVSRLRRTSPEEVVKIDYLYGANWSLWLDVKIILRTLPVLMGRNGPS